MVELQRQLAELRARSENLRAEIEQLKRGGKRQAAPFSRGTRVTDLSLQDASLALARFVTVKPRRPRPSPSPRWRCR